MIVAKIEITMDDQGKVQVATNLDTRIIAFGMLELGKQVLAEKLGKETVARKIVFPPGTFPGGG